LSKPNTIQGERRLAAIMFTDMVGYTAMSQKNEALAVELVEEQRSILRPLFGKHNGQEIDSIGDGFLAEFGSALDAVRCSAEIQEGLEHLNNSRPSDRKILVRIGIHLGDLIHKGDKVFGDAVNIASRIEPLAVPGGICISRQVYDQVRNKVDLKIVPIGKRQLKNVELPVEIFAVEILGNPTSIGSLIDVPMGEEKLENAAVPTGIKALDEILGGGYPDRSTVLIVGGPGIGKEGLGYWFTHSGLSRNDFCLYITRLSKRDILRDVTAYNVDFSQRAPFWFASEGGQIKCDVFDISGLSEITKEILEKNADRRIRIVTDVLSPVLMLNPPDIIYKFLERFLSEVKKYDSVLLAFLEEGMHPLNVLAAMQQLFDGVIELRLYEVGLRMVPLMKIRKMPGLPPQSGYYNFAVTRIGMGLSEHAK
jgi:class 3 adenylate cyclase/KaiC/GvpD/RAD55 family RecA-like ATPase